MDNLLLLLVILGYLLGWISAVMYLYWCLSTGRRTVRGFRLVKEDAE